MPKRKHHLDNRQSDLFGPQPSPVVHKSAEPDEPVDPTRLDDQQLLKLLVNCSLTQVEAVSNEVLRRQPSGWTHALLALWDRFRGFDNTSPMIEQKAVLDVIRHSGRGDLLKQIFERGPLNECLDAHLLFAAAACGIRLPTEIVRRGLSHCQQDVRAAAVELALPSKLAPEMLHPLLTDPCRSVRRLTATVLAESSDSTARDLLLLEMKTQPDRAGLEALGFVANEDVVILLGQIARQHPDWFQTIIDVLEGCDHPKAAMVQAGLLQHTV